MHHRIMQVVRQNIASEWLSPKIARILSCWFMGLFRTNFHRFHNCVEVPVGVSGERKMYMYVNDILMSIWGLSLASIHGRMYAYGAIYRPTFRKFPLPDKANEESHPRWMVHERRREYINIIYARYALHVTSYYLHFLCFYVIQSQCGSSANFCYSWCYINCCPIKCFRFFPAVDNLKVYHGALISNDHLRNNWFWDENITTRLYYLYCITLSTRGEIFDFGSVTLIRPHGRSPLGNALLWHTLRRVNSVIVNRLTGIHGRNMETWYFQRNTAKAEKRALGPQTKVKVMTAYMCSRGCRRGRTV